jgi:lipopolysaccharide export system permease protein
LRKAGRYRYIRKKLARHRHRKQARSNKHFHAPITVIQILGRKRYSGVTNPPSRDDGKLARPKPSLTFSGTFVSTFDRYVAGDISKPLLIFCPALLFLYANFTAIRYLDRVASGLLPPDAVLPLLGLGLTMALEILLPIGFHVSVVVGLSRLYTDSEMTAFFACGITPMRIFRVVAVVSLLVAALVASLTLYVRPWANGLRYLLEHQLVAEFNFADLKPGHFYESASGNRVLFFQAVDPDSGRMQRVFIQTISDDTVTIVSADEAFHQPADDPRAAGFLVCIRARTYDLSRTQNGISQTVSPELVVRLDNPDDVPIGYKRKAAPTWQLAHSFASDDIAELQWRLSTPVSAFLMGLLGFPLSRARPREGKYAKLFISTLTYAVFYNLQLIAKTWVEQGVVKSIPGLWWPHLLLALLIVGLIWKWPGPGRQRARTAVSRG